MTFAQWRAVARALSELGQEHDLLEFIFRVAEAYDAAATASIEAVFDGKLSSRNTAGNAALISLREAVSTGGPAQVFRGLATLIGRTHSLQTLLERIATVRLLGSARSVLLEVVRLRDHLEGLESAYSRFLARSQESSRLVEVGVAAARASTSLRLVSALQGGIDVGVSPIEARDSSERVLELALPSRPTVQEVIEKLTALHGLHVAVCELEGLDPIDAPLSIRRVDAGSLWIHLIGDTRVIERLITLVTEFAKFLHRNYTNEGQIAGLQDRAAAVEDILGMARSLEKDGEEVGDLRAGAKEAALRITRDLNRLLGGESSVTVDGRTYSLEALSEPVPLLPRPRRLLRSGSEPREHEEADGGDA